MVSRIEGSYCMCKWGLLYLYTWLYRSLIFIHFSVHLYDHIQRCSRNLCVCCYNGELLHHLTEITIITVCKKNDPIMVGSACFSWTCTFSVSLDKAWANSTQMFINVVKNLLEKWCSMVQTFRSQAGSRTSSVGCWLPHCWYVRLCGQSMLRSLLRVLLLVIFSSLRMFIWPHCQWTRL